MIVKMHNFSKNKSLFSHITLKLQPWTCIASSFTKFLTEQKNNGQLIVTVFIWCQSIWSTPAECPHTANCLYELHPLSPALCWCTDFPFSKGKPVCHAGEFQRKGSNPSTAWLCPVTIQPTKQQIAISMQRLLPICRAPPTRVPCTVLLIHLVVIHGFCRFIIITANFTFKISNKCSQLFELYYITTIIETVILYIWWGKKTG